MGRDVSVFSYLGARIVASIAGFFTVKFLIEFVARTEYGQWGVLMAATGMLVPVLTLTLPAAMMRMFFDLDREDRAGHARLITTTFWLSLLGAAILAGGAVVIAVLGLVSPVTAVSLVTGTTGTMAFRFFNYLTRLRDDRRMYFFNEVADRAGFMGLLAAANTETGSWIVTAFDGDRLLAAVVLFAGARWAVNLVNIVYYAGKRVLVAAAGWLPAAEIRAMVRFSTPVAVIFFLGWILSASDLFLLKHLSSADELADYAFATSIAAFVALVTQSVLTDWPRFYYEQMRDDLPDRDDRIARRVQLVLWMHVIGIAVLRVIARFAYDVYGADAYLAGLDYLRYLVLANFFFLAGNLFGSGIGYAKKTHLAILAFGLAGGLNVLLNVWLIPRFGGAAAAVTTLMGNVVFAAASWWIGRRHYDFTHRAWHLAPAAAALVVGLLPFRHVLPS